MGVRRRDRLDRRDRRIYQNRRTKCKWVLEPGLRARRGRGVRRQGWGLRRRRICQNRRTK